MKQSRIAAGLLLFGLLVLGLLCFLAASVQASGWPNNNDSIFPPLPAAKPYINFDGRGFIIRGKRTFIVAGELQYPRTPRALWRDRLLRIKRAGYNTVQTYVFWNYHEPVEGQFDFSGEKDLNAYLQLVHALGLYAIVRMGPYVNAEWDTGGLPVWLRFKPGLRPMTDNPQFYQAVTPYLNKLVPILAANQINHGGAILMIQMENEHVYPGGVGGGTDLPDAYYKWYYSKMRAMGLQVPLFFSGLNHNQYPAGDAPFDTSQRTSPWYSTEFWTGWTGHYGYDPDRAKQLQQATWQVIAYGGAGYTHYTMVGGTDFDTWNNNEQAASYDFGAPIGQSGDIRPSYYFCKRAALFAASFALLLSDSVAADGGDGVSAPGSNVQVTRRKGPAGEALFLLNRSYGPVATQIKIGGVSYPSAGPMTLAPYELVPILHGYPLAPGVSLSLAAARLLGVTQAGSLTTLVVYGNVGEPVELHFAAAHARAVGAQPDITVSAAGAVLKTTVPVASPRLSLFQAGKQTIRVLTMRTEMADRTWFLSGGALIACGPDYVGDVLESPNGAVRLVTEQYPPATPPVFPLPALLYLPNTGLPVPLVPVSLTGTQTASAVPPSLGPWKVDSFLPMTLPGYADADWKASPDPLPMGADGDYGAYAWYRTTITVPIAGTYQLHLSDAGDWVSCFVNGRHAASTDVQVRYEDPVPRLISITLSAGVNHLALLTAHYGRNKLFNYYDSMETIDAKGISGPVTLTAAAVQEVHGWKMRGGVTVPPFSSAYWKPLGTDSTGAAAFYHTTFVVNPPSLAGPHPVLRVSPIGLSRGFMWLNGRCIGRYPEKSPVDGLYLPESLLRAGKNDLAVFDEDGNSPSGVKMIVEEVASRTGSVLSVSRR